MVKPRDKKSKDESDFNELNKANSSINVINAKADICRFIPNNIRLMAKNDSQVALINSIKNNEITICAGSPGSGKTFVAVSQALTMLRKESSPYKKIYLVKSVTPLKSEELGFLKGPQPTYEKILTPNGWTTMGEINVGDYVISELGKPIKVLETFDKGEKDVYRITLKDNRYVDCCIDHYWNVKTNNLDFITVNTDFLLKHFNKVDFYLPEYKPNKYSLSNDNIIIDPYLLGVLIGDGCLTGTHIRFCSIDDDIINKIDNIINNYNMKLVKNNITYNIIANDRASNVGAREMKITNLINNEVIIGSLKEIKKYIKSGDSTIIGRCNNKLIKNNYKYEYSGNILRSNNLIKNELIDLKLMGKKSYEKFIPNKYKYLSIDNKFELLRGLLDTDGTIKKNGEITYTTTSKILADDIKELVLSLGGSARVYYYEIKNNNQILNGKKVTQRKPIYTVYIKFINNNYNPFYLKRKSERFKSLDSLSLKIINIEKLNLKSKMKCILVNNETSLYVTKDYIITHNTLMEKIEPFMWSYYLNIEKIISEESLKSLLEKNVIRPFPIAYMRGVTIDDCIVIVDEVQNITIDNIKTIMTRIGSNCKYILLGDRNQIDLKSKSDSSLNHLIKMFDNKEKIGVVEMSKDDVNIRNPIITMIEESFNQFEKEIKSKSKDIGFGGTKQVES